MNVMIYPDQKLSQVHLILMSFPNHQTVQTAIQVDSANPRLRWNRENIEKKAMIIIYYLLASGGLGEFRGSIVHP
jgi:hypothetical protein